MAQNFLICYRDQPMLLPPDPRDWLDEDHLAWFVIDPVPPCQVIRVVWFLGRWEALGGNIVIP
jgi:hypothetical protein